MEKKNSVKLSKCLNGWNWGNVKLTDSNYIQFQSQENNWFDIPTNYISNLTNQNKNELGIEFNYEDEDNLRE